MVIKTMSGNHDRPCESGGYVHCTCSRYLAVVSGVELPKQGSYVCRPDYLFACNYGPELSVALSAYTTLRSHFCVLTRVFFTVAIDSSEHDGTA